MCALGSRHPKKCLSDWEAPGLEENWTVKCSKFPSGPLHCQGMSVRNFCTSGNIFLGGSHSTCQSPLSATSSPLAFPHAVPGALSLSASHQHPRPHSKAASLWDSPCCSSFCHQSTSWQQLFHLVCGGLKVSLPLPKLKAPRNRHVSFQHPAGD